MDPEIPTTIYADAERFVQIVNNVLSNALKYTETGGILFKLSCLKQPNDLYRFSFQISDTGVGIPPEAKDTIFDSFSQMKLDHKRQFGGIGLGLTIVKHVVHLFGGTITIESEPNKGTDVFIDLTVKSIAKERNVKASKTSNETPIHILVVEDNKMNQMVMRKILSTFPKVSFAVASNGQEAIDALKKDVYDMVLMDLQMPIMDGYEATRIIRSGELGKAINTIPIIAVTADAMQETKKRVCDLGMNDYMTKPISRDLLYKKIYACKFEEKGGDDDQDKSLKIA
ncbi:response regulator [Mariniflexile litorale]|uniref:histidine kinase n=1 Tax=Mariniflexile litorale TaxID=3045158 RepID=A0AAU7EKE5_9FLAO|nr:response regulator [Mariniflexile sp. KMM 9835]MDQ8212782.1 response regulator [Mariniflexile sp. KMM 9835]